MIVSEFHTPLQRCCTNFTFWASLYCNVAILMNDTDKIHIFAAKYFDYAR